MSKRVKNFLIVGVAVIFFLIPITLILITEDWTNAERTFASALWDNLSNSLLGGTFFSIFGLMICFMAVTSYKFFKGFYLARKNNSPGECLIGR